MMLLPGMKGIRNEIIKGAKRKEKTTMTTVISGVTHMERQWKALKSSLGLIFSIIRECKGQDYSVTVIEIFGFEAESSSM